MEKLSFIIGSQTAGVFHRLIYFIHLTIQGKLRGDWRLDITTLSMFNTVKTLGNETIIIFIHKMNSMKTTTQAKTF